MSESQRLIYIGKTTQNTRFSKHRSHYKRYMDKKNFCKWYSAFDVLKCEDVQFHIIKQLDDKKDLRDAEKETIRSFRKACFYRVVNKIS